MGFENSGRRPQPSALKILRGKTRSLNLAEPQPPDGVVVMPPGLSVGAVTVWDELAPLCITMGTLTVVDVRPFAMLCELEASLAIARRWKGNRKKLADGLKLERDFSPIIRQYYALFGLDPVSRARIAVPKKLQPTPAAKWAGALK
jgi:hypothetical protein